MNRFDPDSYPLDAFLLKISEPAYEVKSMTLAPGALIGLCALTSLSIACQGLIDVQLPIAGRPVRPVSLNLLFVGESGERRSTVASLLCAPIYAHDERAIQMHEADMLAHKRRHELWKSIKKATMRKVTRNALSGASTEALDEELDAICDQEPEQPRLRRIAHEDLTERSLFEALQGDGESIALITDEGQIVLDSAAMRNLGVLNKCWDGARVLSIDRANHDNIVVRNPRTTTSIMTHEAVLNKFFRRQGDIAHGSGHLARYLIAYPTSTKGYRTTWRDPPEPVKLPTFQARIQELLDSYDGHIRAGTLARQVIEFSDEAAKHWKQAAHEVETHLKPGLDLHDISDFAAKYMEIMSRVAALMHFFCGLEGKISEDTLKRAETITIWHLQEFHRLFGASRLPEEQADAWELAEYLRSHCWNKGMSSVPRSQFLHVGPARTKRRLDAALEILVAQGAVRLIYDEHKNRKCYIHMNSAFFEGGPS
ncbi:DUF3987 domain-containing protein [Xanthomonas sp. CFBP 8703]|uniref:DUF3987 domain-containing protein n=1 Tax=Xanthomonas bonasiae TaxID=2810351 RepID=A0ABS3BA08_9XANT|nr:YfjI family protein [Xanthomonas bonasiae]MBN6104909.1 DUF3987 domain-containing protein [Xanthomonas bonasiae]